MGGFEPIFSPLKDDQTDLKALSMTGSTLANNPSTSVLDSTKLLLLATN